MLAAVRTNDVVIWVHVAAVVIAFGGVFGYPLWLSVVRRAQPAQRALFHRAQQRLLRFVLNPALLVILGAGAYLATDEDVWSEAWVTAPLIILFVIGGIVGAYLIPREGRLAELSEGAREGEYAALIARVQAATLLVAALVLAALFLMFVKP